MPRPATTAIMQTAEQALAIDDQENLLELISPEQREMLIDKQQKISMFSGGIEKTKDKIARLKKKIAANADMIALKEEQRKLKLAEERRSELSVEYNVLYDYVTSPVAAPAQSALNGSPRKQLGERGAV